MWRRWIRRGAFVALTLLVLALAWRTLRAHPIVLDDAYISFRYADNFVHGRGLVYNPGERVEGYTNFLWVMLVALGMRVGGSAWGTATGIGAVSYLLIVSICTAFTVLHARARRQWLVVPALATLILPEGYAAFATTGLETHFVALSLLALGMTQHVVYPNRRWAKALVAGVPLVVSLTRLDASPFVVASGVVTLFEHRRLSGRFRPALAEVARRFAPWAVGVALFMVWRWRYYGDLLPNTYYAKAGNLWNVAAGIAYLKAYALGSPHALLLLPFAVIAAFAEQERRGFARFAALGLSVFLLYVIKVGGDFMHYRFVFEVWPVFFCLAILGLRSVALTTPAAAATLALCTIPAATAPAVMDGLFHQERMEEMDGCCGRPGVRIGVKLRDLLPPTTVIATTQAGGIPFHSKLFTVDQWGLTDRHIARETAPLLPLRRGHVKAATYDYMRQRGVNLVIGHPQVCSCKAPCIEPMPDVFVRLEGDNCLRAWYMTQTTFLTDYFCSRPKDFILYNVKCPAGTEPPTLTPVPLPGWLAQPQGGALWTLPALPPAQKSTGSAAPCPR